MCTAILSLNGSMWKRTLFRFERMYVFFFPNGTTASKASTQLKLIKNCEKYTDTTRLNMRTDMNIYSFYQVID